MQAIECAQCALSRSQLADPAQQQWLTGASDRTPIGEKHARSHAIIHAFIQTSRCISLELSTTNPNRIHLHGQEW